MAQSTQAQIEAAANVIMRSSGSPPPTDKMARYIAEAALTAAAQVGRPVPGETLDDLRIIASGLLADGIDVSKLTSVGRAELRQAIDRILKLANP